jgi:intracellular multiplication protein IcmC
MNITGSFQIFYNIAESLIPVQYMVSGAAYVIGLAFSIKALLIFKHNSESRGQGGQGAGAIKEPYVYLFVAAMLIYLPSNFGTVMLSTFGYSNVLAYGSSGGNSLLFGNLLDGNSEFAYALTVMIQTIGMFAFVKGWIHVAKASTHGQTQGGIGKGLLHVFGGVLALNVVGTLEMLQNTLYGT